MGLIDAEFKEEVGIKKIPNAETLEAIQELEDMKSGTYFLRVQDIDQELFTIPKLKDGSIKVK